MHVATFIKFGERKHMEGLLTEGHMYLNTFKYFREIEDGQVRGDRYEGASEIRRGTKGSITTSDGKDIGATIQSWELGVFPPSDSLTNIFSIFILTPLNYPITDRVSEFGEWAFVVRNPDAFLDRIGRSLKSEEISGQGDRVKYLPNDYDGETGPFQKRKLFQWQSEWRLKIDGGNGGPRTIAMGDLSNIAFVCRTSELNSRFKVTKPGEQDAAGNPLPVK